jgi:hypothetical protein
MNTARRIVAAVRPLLVVWLTMAVAPLAAQPPSKEKLYLGALNVEPRPIGQDASMKYDYDIVYVRDRMRVV